MATINVGGNAITYSFGAIIALLVLVACLVLALSSESLTKAGNTWNDRGARADSIRLEKAKSCSGQF